MIRVRAERIKGKDLQPGDLFSTAGPSYWDQAVYGDSVGEAVFIRTHSASAPDGDDYVFRIHIEHVQVS